MIIGNKNGLKKKSTALLRTIEETMLMTHAAALHVVITLLNAVVMLLFNAKICLKGGLFKTQ